MCVDTPTESRKANAGCGTTAWAVATETTGSRAAATTTQRRTERMMMTSSAARSSRHGEAPRGTDVRDAHARPGPRLPAGAARCRAHLRGDDRRLAAGANRDPALRRGRHRGALRRALRAHLAAPGPPGRAADLPRPAAAAALRGGRPPRR